MTKIHLLVKPTQSGKSFIMLDKISKILKKNKDTVHIIFCDNQLIQTEQINNRVNKDDKLKDISKDDELKDISKDDKLKDISLIFSSKSKIKYSELPHLIIDKKIKIIITCSNKKRVDDIDILLNLESLINKKIFIWIDEIDKNIKLFENNINLEWNNITIVKKIYLITATPSDIENKFKFKNVNLDKTYNKEYYHSLNDSKFIIVDNYENEIETYIENIMKQHSNLIDEGQVWFIPGELNISSHEKIKNILMKLKFTVIIINSNGKQIYTDNKEDELPDDDDELANSLGNYYKKNKLHEKKVAITGNICISRGITINSENMLISHAIFPTKINNESTSYQLAGRICGNIKKFKNYKKPTIFCSSHFRDTILKMENIAKKFAKNTTNNTTDYTTDEYITDEDSTDEETTVKNTTDETVKDTVKKTAKKTAKKTTKNTSNKTAKNTSNETIKDTANKTANEIAKNTSNETIKDTANNTSNETIEDTAKNTTNKTVNNIAKNTTDETTENINEDINEDITENSTNINNCIPILLNLNNKDLSIITDIKKINKKSRTQIEDILKKYKLKNENIDFDINNFKLKNKYCITKNDVDDKGISKYKYQKFIRYHTQKIKYTTKKCRPNEYIIYIITDDINIWNAKAGDSIILYKNDKK